jgi:hypothetical protein
MATAPRPRMTTRDPEELVSRPTVWCESRFSGAAPVDFTGFDAVAPQGS